MEIQQIKVANGKVGKVEPLRGHKTLECPLKVGMIPVMLKLYDTIHPRLRSSLQDFAVKFCRELSIENIEISCSPIASSDSQVRQSCAQLAKEEIDLLVIAHLCYAPSGEIAPALLDSDLPLLLLPAQPMLELVPQKYDDDTMFMNHSVHGTMDLANVLHRRGKNFGILYGHRQNDTFKTHLLQWTQAGRVISAMKKSNPVVLGGRFEKMLDLQLDNELFIRELGAKAEYLALEEFAAFAQSVSEGRIKQKTDEYRDKFVLHKDLSDVLLKKTARHDLALRQLLDKYHSYAFGINFVNACRLGDVADGLHVPASILMTEGKGYAGEGDWETAMFMRGLQSVFGHDNVSFTEIFSVGYKDARFVLRHWGEGNFAMARQKPILAPSVFNGAQKVNFSICDFEFQPGRVTLVNLSATPKSEGQIISISGTIESERLPRGSGPRAIFKPNTDDICKLLNDYSTLGGSHHMVMVKGSSLSLLNKLAKITGWKYFEL